MATFADGQGGSGGGGGGGGYQQLVGQVAELQAELTKTVAVCGQLRHEHDTASHERDALKVEVVNLRDKYSHARRKVLEEAQNSVALEQQHERVIEDWRRQLEEKAHQFEELQARLAPPRDLEMLKLKIQEELEGPHHARVRNLETEVQKYKDMFHNIRRAHELVKTQLDQHIQSNEKSVAAMHATHDETVKQLRAQLQSERESAADSNHESTIRALQRSVEELTVCNSSLHDEVAEARDTAHQALVQQKQTEMSRTADLTKAQTALRNEEVELASAARKLTMMQVEIDRANSAVIGLKQQLVAAREDAGKSQQALEREQQERAQENAMHVRAMEALREQEAVERRALQAKVVETQHDLKTSTLRAREGAVEKEQMVDRLQEKVRRLRRELQDLQETSTHETSRLETEAERCARERQSECAESAEEIDRLKEQMESVSLELKRNTREKDVLQERLASTSEALVACEQQLENVQSEKEEMEREYGCLQDKHRELRSNEYQMVEAQKHLEMALTYRKHDIESLESTNSRVESAYAKALIQVENVRASANETVEQTKADVIAVLASERGQARKRIGELKSKLTSYKGSLVKCKDRIQQLKNKYAQLSRENKAQQELFKAQVDTHERRVRQAERDRDLALRRLTGGFGGCSGSSGFNDGSNITSKHTGNMMLVADNSNNNNDSGDVNESDIGDEVSSQETGREGKGKEEGPLHEEQNAIYQLQSSLNSLDHDAQLA